MKEITLLLFVMVTLAACKKEPVITDPAPTNPFEETEKKIRHNWTFDYTVLNEYIPNQTTDTIFGVTGDYFEFLATGKAHSFWNGLHDTVDYKVIGTNTMVYGGDTVTFTNLNTTEFIFTRTTQTSSTHHDNVIRLSK